jgi:adenine-specific DNA-methyltransferase
MKQFEKLKAKLAELFQLDQADLDFGIYRIMNARREEIIEFLDRDLLPQVQEALGEYKPSDRAEIQKQLDEAVQQARTLGAEPETLPKIKELRTRLAEDAVDLTALENEVYSRLYDFFNRYYDEGDFISLRRYKEGVYAIPYEGEEVKLHWANSDQYYIKTTENFRDYAFRTTDGHRVHFKIVEADTEKDNIKAANSNDRRFVLRGEDAVDEENGELVIRFEYRPDGEKRKQDAINSETVQQIIERLDDKEVIWRQRLGVNGARADGTISDRTILEKHLSNYTKINAFDYFIHKGLGDFLRRELDFYIKNEVMHLDDVESESAARVEQYLSKIKVIRQIAHKIIGFLAQIEDFQKKLWLKKKFIVDTSYCVTLDHVPRELFPDVIANDSQREEWVRLFAIDEIKANLTTPCYSNPLTAEFLTANDKLVLDTKFFNEEFKLRLVSSIDELDERCDGILVHSESFQALNLIQERFREQLKCIYIDPPYNTAASEINYKNNYKHSSWLTMINNSLSASKSLLSEENGVICGTIDDVEQRRFSQLFESQFGDLAGTVSIRIKPSGRPIPNGFALSHEYAVFARTNPNYPIARLGHSEEQKARYCESDEKGDYFWEMFRKAGSNSNRSNRPTMYYPFFLDMDTSSLRLPDMEYDSQRQEFLLLEQPADNELVIYPIKDDGSEGRWYFGLDRARRISGEFKPILQGDKQYRIYYRRRLNEGVQPTTLWFDSKYSATEHGTALLKDIFGEQETFSYPKSLYAVVDCLTVAGVALQKQAIVLDYYAGSGTTAHAVVSLNRQDGGGRKYILIEMADYLDSVTRPRIQKVIYSKQWKNGKPIGRDGVSHMLKCIRLESYEDALANIQLIRTDAQQSLLDQADSFRESYMLGYMLDTEAAGSASLMSIEAFEDPFAYKLLVGTGSVGETKPVNVDLVETFNWLLGLRVKHMSNIRGIRVVEGTNPRGEKVLVIWRNIKETSNEGLEEFFKKQQYNTLDMEFDLVYVNGDNNLMNIPVVPEEEGTEPGYKVRLIEEEFKRLMFDVTDV